MNILMDLQRYTPPRRRGSVLIFVVAVLVLLTVMGTAYLLSSRLDRGATRATSDTANMDLARDAALNHLRQLMFDLTQINSGTGIMGAPGGTLLYQPPPWQAGTTYTVSAIITGADGLPYSCKTAHTSSVAAAGPPPTNLSNWTLYTTGMVRTRNFDYPNPGLTGASWTDPAPPAGATYQDTTVTAEPFLVKGFAAASTSDFSVLTKTNRFDAKTGAYDATTALPAAAEVAVMDPVGGTLDAIWNLLPFSSASGLRYRYALRVVDTNRFINLNVAAPNTAPADAAGQYLTNLALGNTAAGAASPLLAADTTTAFGTARSSAAWSASAWQTALLTYETPATTTTLFDLSDELELRAYGTRGNNYNCRPTTALPNTLAAGAATNRQYYTTYSFDRNLCTVGAGRFKFTGPNGALSTWPAGPNRQINLGVMPAQNGSTIQTLTDQLAQNAAYLANAMAAAGYSDDEALSYAVNYTAQTYYNYYVDYPGHCTGDPAWYTPYIGYANMATSTNYGLVLATTASAKNTYLITYAVAGGNPTKTYVAYAAQPFLNEVADVNILNPPTYFAAATDDFGVELAVPSYGLPKVNVKNWRLRVYNQTSATTCNWVKDLSTPVSGSTTFNAGLTTGSYAVVTNGVSSSSSLKPTGSMNVLAIKNLPIDGSIDKPANALGTGYINGYVALDRPYYDAVNTGTIQYVQADIIGFAIVPSWDTSTYVKNTCARANYPATGGATPDPWMCTACYPSVAQMNSAPYPATPPVAYNVFASDTNPAVASPATLGSANTINGTGCPGNAPAIGLRLPDFFADINWTAGSVPTSCPIIGTSGGTAPYAFAGNIGDLNRYYSRIALTDTGTGSGHIPTVGGSYPEQLADPTSLQTQITATTYAQQEGKLHLNFFNDPRARRFLQLVAPVDRAGDGKDQLGAGATDTLDEVRLPGRINVNTASDNVLMTIPNMTAPMAANIHAYRDRLATYTNASIAGCTATASFATYSGLGIRSLADLLIPLQGPAPPATPTPFPTTSYFTQRDALWASIHAYCTTRSDTFAVYGYMEAVKQNTNAGAPAHDNAADWYTGTYADDPSNTTAKMIRVAKRRFLALVDRSWCNVPRAATWAAGNLSAADASGNVYVWNGGATAPAAAPPGTNWVQIGVVPPTVATGTQGVFRLPRVVALKDLPN